MIFKCIIENGLLIYLDKRIDQAYLDMVEKLSLMDDSKLDKDISIVYTPLNGAGSIPVKSILLRMGFTNVVLVPEQEKPDPDFTTVGYPNPEDTKAFALAEKLGRLRQAKLLIATDPDSDRFAMEVMNETCDYVPINGNQTGVLLINYILEAMIERDILPKNGAIVKSIVTGDLGKVIAENHGIKVYESLTGFKNICGKIPAMNKDGFQYLFGYEESIGYAPSEQVRDKDGVSTAMLVCEAAAYYQKKGKSLLDVLQNIYQKYGYYIESQVSLVYEGMEGAKRIERMMAEIRRIPFEEIGEIPVKEVTDFKEGYKDIGVSNVLKYMLEDGSWFAVRPSGTEPKIKVYIYSTDKTKDKAVDKIQKIKEIVINRLENIN